jgi:hypothetical protein
MQAQKFNLNWHTLSLSLLTVSWQEPTVLYVDG